MFLKKGETISNSYYFKLSNCFNKRLWCQQLRCILSERLVVFAFQRIERSKAQKKTQHIFYLPLILFIRFIMVVYLEFFVLAPFKWFSGHLLYDGTYYYQTELLVVFNIHTPDYEENEITDITTITVVNKRFKYQLVYCLYSICVSRSLPWFSAPFV